MPLHPCTDACRYAEMDTAILRLLEDNAKLIRALNAIYDLAGYHTDDSASLNDKSPDDMAAHTNGLIRQECMAALDELRCDAREGG